MPTALWSNSTIFRLTSVASCKYIWIQTVLTLLSKSFVYNQFSASPGYTSLFYTLMERAFEASLARVSKLHSTSLKITPLYRCSFQGSSNSKNTSTKIRSLVVMTTNQLLKRHRNGARLCLALNNQTVINLGPVHIHIRIFLNPQLFLSGYENIRVHTLCDHSVFMSNSPVHTYSDSLRIHWELTKLSHQALVRPGLTQNRRGQHCFPTRLSCFCRPFCPVDNVKSSQMSSRLLA